MVIGSVIWLAACATPVAEAPTVEEPTMSAVDALVRTSLDLRGVRPSLDEIAAVEADPTLGEGGALAGLVDTFLEDPRYEGRVRDLWAEIYLTRAPSIYVNAATFGLGDEPGFEVSTGEEVLAILGHVAAADLPWTDIVTADWTMADEITASIWPIDRPVGEGWQVSHYTDGRPAAGVLATNSLWWRYGSTDSNANRKRANTASRVLLCNDYLVRPLEFDRNINLLDEEAVADAINNDPSCTNCHNSLDPLASYFFGFWWYDPSNSLEIVKYFPERESRWALYTQKAPSYYGEPGYNLHDLGQQIAGDHRFPTCAVEQAWELLLRREVSAADTGALVTHRDAFINGGLTMKALMRSMVMDPRYRAGATDTEGFVPLKMITPDLLATSVEGLTGYTWTYGGYDLLRTDNVGYRTLAGGADGYAVTATSTSPNATLVVVQQRLAEAAAWYVVENEPARLFTVDFTETPETDRAAMVTQLQGLHKAVFGRTVAADGGEVEAGLALWADLYAVERDTRDAWAGVLSILLRDPDFLYY
ncbi:MAG: hypothetical protein Q8P18_14375 [Pseudomonadota bacterium]|nr:hypothetical protein [Pseudomonadota bacterium]